MDTFVYKDHKKLRCGYTTGTCAALAAQGAVRFLLTGSWKETEEIMTPKGIPVCVSLEEKTSGDSWAECAVRKDAGDDYDVTNGILVYARAEFVKDKNFYEKVQMSHLESSGFGAAGEKPGLSPENQKQQKKANAAHQKEALPESLVRIDGGIGIGRITKSGLDQPVGAAAINSVPRKMIRDAVYELLEEAGWKAGADGIREKDGVRAGFTLMYPASDSVRQALAADTANQLKEVGIEVKIEGVGWDDAYDRAQTEPLMWGWGAHTPMELYNIYHTMKDTGLAEYSPYANDSVDRYMDEALASGNLEDSYELWKKAQWDGTAGVTQDGDIPWIWLVNIDHLYWSRNGLKVAEQKIHPHGHGWSIVNNVDQWSWE